MNVVVTGLWPVDLCCLSHQGRTAHRAVATAATVLFKPLWRIAKSLNWIMFGFARAPVAQLDRALASGAKGCGFDPRRAQSFAEPQNDERLWLAHDGDAEPLSMDMPK